MAAYYVALVRRSQASLPAQSCRSGNHDPAPVAEPTVGRVDPFEASALARWTVPDAAPSGQHPVAAA